MILYNKFPDNKKAFASKLQSISHKLGIDPNWLIAIMWHESKLDPKAENSIGAVGLIQFLPSTCKTLNVTPYEVKYMSGVQQLELVYRYYRAASNKFNTITDIFLYTLFPVAVIYNWPDYKVLEWKNLTAETIAKANKPIDLNNDGKITVAEVRKEALKSLPKEFHKYEVKNNSGLLKLIALVAGIKIFGG